VSRHILWQAVLALLGVALIFIILFQLASSVVTTEEIPVAGGRYIEGVLGFSEAINPILAPIAVQANPVDQDLCAMVFNGLTSLDEAGQIAPDLALDWEVSEGGTVYEFRLRRDVTWHDGAPFSASDVRFTVQAIQDPGYQGAPSLRELWRTVSVEEPDQYTVRFTLEEPFPSFIYYTTVGMLPAHLLSDVAAADLPTHEFSTRSPIGTGRFMVDEVAPDRVVLVPNPDYRGPELFLDGVELWFFSSMENLLLAYERGEIHGFHPDRSQALTDLARYPDLGLYSAQSAGLGLIYLNLAREVTPFFQAKEIRQALLYALDRRALIDQVLGGQGLVADSPILPTTWAYDPSVKPYIYDPERAIGLLDASGWVDTDGDRIRDQDQVPLAFTLLTGDDPAMVRLAEEVAGYWRAVGVDATVRPTDGGAMTSFVQRRDFDAALVELGLVADPDPYPLWHSTQISGLGQNFSGFANEEADLIMEEARLTTDSERRAELYRSFQQLFAEEVPSLLVFYPIYSYAVDSQVHDVQLPPILHTSDRFRNIDAWYVTTEEVVVTENEELDKRGD
jgi:peptide/nickel transport system substrate-binding protein